MDEDKTTRFFSSYFSLSFSFSLPFRRSASPFQASLTFRMIQEHRQHRGKEERKGGEEREEARLSLTFFTFSVTSLPLFPIPLTFLIFRNTETAHRKGKEEIKYKVQDKNFHLTFSYFSSGKGRRGKDGATAQGVFFILFAACTLLSFNFAFPCSQTVFKA